MKSRMAIAIACAVLAACTSTEPNQNPVAAFDAVCEPSAQNVEAHCTFWNRSSDPEGGHLVLRWEFGDGGKLIVQDNWNPTQYYYAGNPPYTVTLSVTDENGGRASTQRMVTW